MRILSGIQPSGKLHLGNYFSMMKKMIEYQNSSDLFCFIANLHSLTSFTDRKTLEENTIDAVCDFLALGIDPEKSTFWIQSDVQLVTELTWYLSMCITESKLSLAHSYKDKIAKGIQPSGGLFMYPILMAADILAFNSDRVPVGKDQKQHLEYTRDIGIRFNQEFGETFKIPEPEIDESTAIVPGVDGQKMSKSYGNTINIFDTEDKLKKSVMSIVSDSAGVDEAKNPENSVIFSIYSLFLNSQEEEELRDRFLTPGLKYGDIKKELFSKIMDYFLPFRKKREMIAEDKKLIQEILQIGSKKAINAALPQLEKARQNLGLKGHL
ncbi:MAG: tryptophan--tRNA ligase [Leptospiraceae bacterium]|nr:tryptophan--tRNA ligase [Leptospiraceae bacterium]MCK6382339.1 tryptophan--tRNA ligase [Leptospiraceae bacterium]NUM40364.1 tryptophan--tRNA ligase [Leptospiraceae bacterium]